MISAIIASLMLIEILIGLSFIVASVSSGFSSFSNNNPQNRYEVDGKWLTEKQILDKYGD